MDENREPVDAPTETPTAELAGPSRVLALLTKEPLTRARAHELVVAEVQRPAARNDTMAMVANVARGDSRPGRIAGWAKPTAAEEEAEYCRALLTPEQKEQLGRAGHGAWTIADVRAFVKDNCSKASVNFQGEAIPIDPESMNVIDIRVDFPVYVAGDNIYTREELLAHYPFEALGVAPEDVFVQQMIAVFPPGAHQAEDEYIAQDAENPDDPAPIETLVARVARLGWREADNARPLKRVVKTKVYLGKDSWRDFQDASRQVRVFSRYVAPAVVAGASRDTGIRLLQGVLSATGRGLLLSDERGPLSIQDAAGAAAAEAARGEEEQRRREAHLAEMERRAADLAAREAELKRRETELLASLGL